MKQVPFFIGALVLFSHSLWAATPNPPSSEFTDAQKAQIEKIVHDYIVNNPQVLVEASQALHQQELNEVQKNSQKAIAQHVTELFNDPASPVLGNLKGNVVLVEFMDYQCGHCKEMESAMVKLRESNPDLKVIYKELPVFGAASEYAAKAALASMKQGKFKSFHEALMNAEGPLSEDVVMNIAKTSGLDINKLKADMQNKDYFFQLKSNYSLAKSLGILGTPTFIVASHVDDKTGQTLRSYYIPGAVAQSMLQKIVDEMKTN